MFLSACVFSEKPSTEYLSENSVAHEEKPIKQLGDSIRVDTVIGDFRLFYRVSEVLDSNIPQPEKDRILDKEILLNVQKLDTTTVVSNKHLTVADFCSALEKDKEKYYIDSFYLKEVKQDSLLFGVELRLLKQVDDKQIIDMELVVEGNGDLVYRYTERVK